MTGVGQSGGIPLGSQSADLKAAGLTKLLAVLEDLRALEDRDQLAEYLIETAGRFTGIPEAIVTRPYPESHRVPGCESEAFVFAQAGHEGSVRLYFAVENPQGISAKALATILAESLSGLSALQIQRVPEDIVHEIFGATVSMGKGQGLIGMIRSAKGAAFQAAQSLKAED